MADLTIELEVDAGNSASVLNNTEQRLGSLQNAIGTTGDAFGAVEGAIGGFTSLMHVGEQQADNLARAELAVEQASLDLERATSDASQAQLDMEQSARDLEQAQLDVNQAERDGAQAGIDLEQALLDQKKAQKDYADAVKEFGANSLEAQQAQIDMKQADEDVRQAKQDAKQATEDGKQALLDAKQATQDHTDAQLNSKQATLDSKQAQLDLNEAQRNVVSADIMDSWVGIGLSVGQALLSLVGIFAVLNTGMLATATASVGAALTTAGSWIAMAATSVASALVVAGAWLLSIWPIALIVAAVIGLAVVIVKNWDTIKNGVSQAYEWMKRNVFEPIGRFFTETIPRWARTVRDAIVGAWNSVKTGVKSAVDASLSWIRDKWNSAVSFFSGIPGKIAAGAKGMWNFVTDGLKGALNSAIDLVNGAIFFINDKLISNANRIPGVNIPFIPYVPFLAEGGITTGPTMAMIGEGREQEAVLPLSKLQGLIDMTKGSGGQGMTVSFAPTGGDAFMEWLMETIRIKFGGDVSRLGSEA